MTNKVPAVREFRVELNRTWQTSIGSGDENPFPSRASDNPVYLQRFRGVTGDHRLPFDDMVGRAGHFTQIGQ